MERVTSDVALVMLVGWLSYRALAIPTFRKVADTSTLMKEGHEQDEEDYPLLEPPHEADSAVTTEEIMESPEKGRSSPSNASRGDATG